MTTTVRELVTGALRLINVVQANETPTDDDMDVALSAFRGLIDSWSNGSLMIYSINPYNFPIIAGKHEYTLGIGGFVGTVTITNPGTGYTDGIYFNVPLEGTYVNVQFNGSSSGAQATVTVTGGVVTDVTITDPGQLYAPGNVLGTLNTYVGNTGTDFTVTVDTVTGADWSVDRPMKINQAYVRLNTGTQQQLDLPLVELTDNQFSSLAVKNTPSTFPFYLYDNGNYPLRTVSLWPVPQVDNTAVLWLMLPLVNFDDLDTPVDYPPGYERAFRFNLAVEVAAEWGKDVPDRVETAAINSKQELRKLNSVPQYMQTDGGTNAQRKTFPWITGGFIPGSRV